MQMGKGLMDTQKMSQLDLSEGVVDIFRAMREGTLLELVARDDWQVDDGQDLKRFLPSLLMAAFTSTSEDSPQMDALRSRLINFRRDGNAFLQLMRLNFTAVEERCQTITPATPCANDQRTLPFAQLNDIDKVCAISVQLLRLRTDGTSSSAPCHFPPFDEEQCGDEAVGILCLLSHNLPHLFNPVSYVSALLAYGNGSRVVVDLVLNHPDLTESIMVELLDAPGVEDANSHHTTTPTPSKRGDPTLINKQRRESIFTLLPLLTPAQVGSLLKAVLVAGRPSHGEGHHSQLMHKIAVDILCSSHVSTDYFLDLLIPCLMLKGDPFTVFLTKHGRNSLRRICERVSREMQVVGGDSSRREKLCKLVALVCAYSFRLSNEEARQWLWFLTDAVDTEETKDHHPSTLKCALAALIASPSLTPNQAAFRDETAEQRASTFFQRLKQLVGAADISRHYSSLGEMMLLIAIHMGAGNDDELGGLLSSVLGFKLHHSQLLKKIPTLKSLYLRHAMTERDIVEAAARLEVTRSLSANTGGGYLPIHCISHLMASRAFARHQIPIEGWIKAQLMECTTPVHSRMPALLEGYAASCLPTADYPLHCNRPIEEDFFSRSIFPAPDQLPPFLEAAHLRLLAHQALALFYLIVYSHLREVLPPIRSASVPSYAAVMGSRLVSYSSMLWARIPIRYLLLVVDARHSEFSHLRPPLLRFIGASMPHLMPPLQASLEGVEQELTSGNNHHLPSPKVDWTGDLYLAVSQLEHQSIRQQWRHLNAISSAMLSSLNKRGTPRPCVEKLVKLWERLETVAPRRLYETTLQHWLNSSAAATRHDVKVDEEMLLRESPLVMFRVDERVFASAPHLRCLMRILQFYLEAAKSRNNLRLLKACVQSLPSMKSENDEKSHLLKSLVGTQSLTVVQLLLDLCDGDEEERPELIEIREVACAQIHQMFIADSLLAKLVHFNMYPLRLIPVVVELVPSVHLLIRDIDELLVADSLERRVFGITLMAHLVRRYRIPAAFAGVELAVGLIDTTLACSVNAEHIVMFAKMLPALEILIKISPFHADCIKETLRRVESICQSRIAMLPSYLVVDCYETHLISAINSKRADE